MIGAQALVDVLAGATNAMHRSLHSVSTSGSSFVGSSNSTRQLQFPGDDASPVVEPSNKGIGVLLILVASISWGAYGGVRKHYAPNAENVPFMVNQQLAQLVFALLVVLPQWDHIQTQFSMEKFIFVFFAGTSRRLTAAVLADWCECCLPCL
jgi:hypothetical protein